MHIFNKIRKVFKKIISSPLIARIRQYVFVRENSVEWNEPEINWQEGNVCGIDPCMYGVQDNPQVIYYDDPMFDEISDKTRWFNETRTCLCGGHGERIELTSSCCYGLCYRASYPLPCVPICVPTSFFPCARRREIYLQDAAEGIHEMKKAVRNAREHDPLYQDVDKWDLQNSGSGSRSDEHRSKMELLEGDSDGETNNNFED